jgi:hypothetical protein
MRKAAHEALNKTAAASYYPIQRKEAIHLVDGLLRGGDGQWESQLSRSVSEPVAQHLACTDVMYSYTTSGTLSIVYDSKTLSSSEDPLIKEILKFTDKLIYAVYPGSYLVEFLPWLEYAPEWLAKWKRQTKADFRHFSSLFLGLFTDVEARIVREFKCFHCFSGITSLLQNDGDERPSFAGTLIRSRDRHDLSDEEAAWLCATV